jgi:hypothetical protein
MEIFLVVARPFGGFARGDVVTDAARIAEILEGEHAGCVVRVLRRQEG